MTTTNDHLAAESNGIVRSLAHAGFTLVRDYSAPVAAVWAAFAEEDQKMIWFGGGGEWEAGEWQSDFRVGGHDVAEGKFHDGPRSRYEADYTDIVEEQRIVTTYNMWLDGVHISTSVATYEFEAIDGGTRLTHAEHGVYLDGHDPDGNDRERGSAGLLDAIEAALRPHP